MSLLVIGFFVILLLSFGLIALATRPSEDEKIIARRLSSLHSEDAFQNPAPGSYALLKSDTRTESPWVSAALERYELARKLRALLVQADSKITLERFLFTSAGLAIAGFLIAYLFAPLLFVAVPVAVLAGAAPAIWLNYSKAKRLKAFNSQLSNAVDMMSNALRAGNSVVGAIGILGEQNIEPCASEFREVFRQQSFGLPLREALLEMLERVPSADLRVVITAILVQRDTGGNLGEILDRTVFVIRERVRIQGEIKVQTAQGRVTGWVLTALPVVLLFMINFINPGYSDILLHDAFGHKLIYTGIVLLILGGLSIRHMINKIEV